MKNLKMNTEIGSIALFILIAMIFILIVLGAIYLNNRNASTQQEREIEQIERSYNVKDEEMIDEYNKVLE